MSENTNNFLYELIDEDIASGKVVADEIHHDLIMPGYEHTEILNIKGYEDMLVAITAGSKTFNLAGCQNSYVILPDEKLRAEYDAFMADLRMGGGAEENLLRLVPSRTVEMMVANPNGAEIQVKVTFDKEKVYEKEIKGKPYMTVDAPVKQGDVLADGPATKDGEVALGKNALIGFMTWEGYNYEDAVLLNERLVRDDVYTSIHIEEYYCESRDTKLGPEEITRQLPNKITVVAEDRTPVARVNIAGNKKSSGKVVDSEGVVFSLYPGTSMLPTIYEKKLEASEPGMRLKKRALSALRLLETCRQPEFQDLGVLDVDITKDDYILATLGDYSRVKIAWEGMDDFSPESKIRMTAQLNDLAKAIRTRTAPAQMWNATVPGAVALDPKGSNQ